MRACTVLELWRYPVKSLLGESLQEARVETRGFVADRLYAITDTEERIGSGKTTRRFRRLDGLFELRARSGPERPIVTVSDGRELTVGDPRLDQFLSRRYGDELRVVRESSVPHQDAAPLHLLTTSSLSWLAALLPAAQVDRRRFRPNIVLDCDGEGLIEDSWVGHRFALGTTIIRVSGRAERCVMATYAQADLPKDPAILDVVAKMNDNCLGVLADVETAGIIRIGDRLKEI